jgi:haloalkane dehalogenase
MNNHQPVIASTALHLTQSGVSIDSPVCSSSSPNLAMSDWKADFDFPSRFVVRDGCRQHYLDQNLGERANANPIVMVHGNPTWSFYWRRLVRTLQPQYRVIAVDHMGCGLSDKPVRYEYCLQKHIDNLIALIDDLDLKQATLVAHDWGGAIGLGALLARKSRFRRIILFNTGAFPPTYLPFRIRVCRWPLIGKIAVQGFNLFARAATVMATEQQGGLRKSVADGLLFPYDNWQNRTAIYRFVQDIPLTPRHRTWSVLDRIEAGLAELASWPIMLVWGMQDWCFRPECLRRFQQHWPKAVVHELHAAGHYVVEDAPAEVAQLVEQFLSTSNR